MTVATQKHEKIIDEAVTRLFARATENRGLTADDLKPRVARVLEKTFKTSLETVNSTELREFIDALQIDDLCLVMACERGDDAAWQVLFTDFGATVKSAARKITSNKEDAEDLANSIWAELHGMKIGSNGKPSGKLSYYSGRGSLAGWLRAVVAQLAIDAHRKQSRFVQVEEDREFENLAHEADKQDLTNFHSTNENPEKSLAEKRIKQDVGAALKKAIVELAAEDKLLVKLYYFDDLNLKQAGQILGFHEATASRRIVKIQTNLRKKVEQVLATENGWKSDEINEVLSNATGILQMDVEKLIKN